MYQPRRVSSAAVPERPTPEPFAAARRAARRTGSALLSRAVPAVVSIGMLAGVGGISLNAHAEQPAAAVPAPVRSTDTTSRSDDRDALVATTDLPAEEAPAAATPAPDGVAFVGGSWSDAFGTVTGTRFTQRSVEVRARAAGEATVLATVERGTEVKVTDKSVDGWTQVASATHVGWIRSEDLGGEPDPVASPDGTRGELAWPTAGGIGSPWGMRMHPILKYKRLHGGVDIGGATGQPVYAAEDGVVTRAALGYNSGSGNNVRIDNGTLAGRSVETSYLHLNSISVQVGQRVRRGQLIGTVGSTGLSTAPHLHFSLYLDGVNSNPAPWLG